MKKWPFVVAVLYGSVLLALFVPLFFVAFLGDSEVAKITEVFASIWLWVPLAIMVAAQFALLRTPVAIAARRPVTRRPLLVTLIAAAFMMGMLVVGVAGCIYEFLAKDVDIVETWWLLVVGGASWAFWAVYFYRSTSLEAPDRTINRLRRFMWSGSILEFLVAVPTHIIARNRDYCCAGYLTFIGLTCGLSVMLFAFGPALFFLFVERWRRLHPTGQRN